jgi:antitoxin component of RelBE/YafQ-DinJ toxin-antitoxin module
MSDKHIIVIADDKTVAVEGLSFKCLKDVPADLHALRWVPGQKPPGYIERKYGDSHGFSDFSIVAPYMPPWQAAKKDDDARKEAQKIERKKAQDDLDARVAEQRRKAEERKDLNSALNELGLTDHEVIKAMEAMLADQGKLPEDLLTKRREARAKAKAEKKRLGL